MKILRVDLGNRSTRVQTIGDGVARKYLGGSALGARLLYDETSPETDPLGPGNPLMLLTGPVTGTSVPTSGRYAVVARSPLTGLWADSDSGGSWGPALRRAGFDGVILEGKSDKLVYLWLHDGQVEIREASHLAGKDVYETDLLVKAETSRSAVTSCIGPAGEKQVRMACILCDGKHGRAAGRGGLGAVMGSKGVKAIAADGSRKVPVANPEALKELVKVLAPTIVEKTKGLHILGTPGLVMGSAQTADLPVKNWRVGDWVKEAEKISGQAMANTILTGRFYCGSCIVGCGREVKVVDGPYAGVDGAGPEYEALAGLGSMCLVNNLEAVAMANELCNRYGIDVMSCGGAIAFAMEAYEKGILTPADVDGIDLTWGNPDAVIAMVHKIGKAEGIGALLGQGVRAAAAALGSGSEAFAIQIKGLEVAFHDPRSISSLAPAYATYPRGGCHRGMSQTMERFGIPELGVEKAIDRHSSEGKGAAVARYQDYFGMLNSLKICHFIASAVWPSHAAQLLNAVTGWDTSGPELVEVGERFINLTRVYNVRCGIRRKDDDLHPRLKNEAFSDGGSAGYLPPTDAMVAEYYRQRGWSEEGMPTEATLRRLGLDKEWGDLKAVMG